VNTPGEIDTVFRNVKSMEFYKNFTCLLFALSCIVLAKNEASLYSDQDWVITKSKAAYKNTEIYDANKMLLELKKTDETPECKVNYNFDFNPLSLVGNYFSYEFFESGYYACGVPSSSHRVKCINVSSLQPVLLNDCFTDKSIIKAFKSDPWIQTENQHLSATVDTITTVASLTSILGNVGMDIRFYMDGFAIGKYDTIRNLVAVRLIGSQYMGFDHSAPLQLGLWLEPKPAFKNVLRTGIKFVFGKFSNDLH
jgi:hypothetical protein